MAKTGTLSGFEGEVHQDIIDKAEQLTKIDTALSKKRVERGEMNIELVDLMKEHKLKEYIGPDGLRVTLQKPKGGLKAKVRYVEEHPDEPEEAEVE